MIFASKNKAICLYLSTLSLTTDYKVSSSIVKCGQKSVEKCSELQLENTNHSKKHSQRLKARVAGEAVLWQK